MTISNEIVKFKKTNGRKCTSEFPVQEVNQKLKVVIPLSGGKDSQACLKLAVEHFGHEYVQGLFCDTQFEHPLTYKHIEKLKTLYGPVNVLTITRGDVLSESIKAGRFPGGGARHCTDRLKIRPSRDFYRELALHLGRGFEVWYGVRWDESGERAKRYGNHISTELYNPHEFMPSSYPKYLGRLGVSFRLPILDWHTQDVMEYLDGEENPLYEYGFERVGCFPCLAGGDRSKEAAFNFDEFGSKQYRKTQEVSVRIQKDIFRSKGGQERNKESIGCSICTFT